MDLEQRILAHEAMQPPPDPRALAPLLCACLLAACGDDSDSSSTNGLGVPKGAFSVTFIDDGPMGSQGCPVVGHSSKIGEVTDTTKPTLLQDTQQGASVQCSVAGGGPFTVEAQIAQGAVSFGVSIQGLTAGVTEAAPAHARVTYASATTVEAYESPAAQPCNVYFTAASQGIASGRVWFGFDCPDVEAPGGACMLGNPQAGIYGYAIFEQCSR